VNNLKPSVYSHLLLAAIFLWLQLAIVAHAYEHLHEEHTVHQCVVCLIHAHCDDLANLTPETTACFASKSEILITAVSPLLNKDSFPFHSRAPPAKT
jgi:hypothetical protein